MGTEIGSEKRPERHRASQTLSRALLFVLFTLILLVAIPVVIGCAADSAQTAALEGLRLPAGRQQLMGHARTLRNVEAVVTVVLGVLSLIAGSIVLRAQGFILRSMDALAEEESKLSAAEQNMRHLAFANARRVRELEAIFSISQDLSLQGGTDRMVGRLTEEVARLFGAEKCLLWLCAPDNKSLEPQFPAFGFSVEELRGVRLELTPGGWAYSVLHDDVPAVGAPASAGEKEVAQRLGLRSALAVRLAASGKLLGVLAVYNKQDGSPFTDEEAQLLRTFAGQAAFAIHSAQLYGEANRRANLLAWAMQETHHRIKNNLQAVSAILEVQAMDLQGEPVPPETLRDVVRQIRTIAVVHDLLSQNRQGLDEGSVSARTAIERLVPVITMGRMDRRIRTKLDVDDVPLNSKLATSLGLIVNELVSNALKHANPPHGELEVTVSLHAAGDAATLVVQDNGAGFPPGFEARSHCHVGIDLVRMLVERDLAGTIQFTNAHGGRVEARIPLMSASRGAKYDYQFAESTRSHL